MIEGDNWPANRDPDPIQRKTEHVAELAVCLMQGQKPCSPTEAVDLVMKCYAAAKVAVQAEVNKRMPHA